MKAAVRGFHSPDVEDLVTFAPEDPRLVRLLWQVFVGPAEGEGEESFDIEICTLGALAAQVDNQKVVGGRHMLFVNEYDYEVIASWVHTYVDSCEGENWEEVAEKLARIGRWEFEDYVKGI